MSRYEALLLDVDGTLLDDEERIHQDTFSELRRIRDENERYERRKKEQEQQRQYENERLRQNEARLAEARAAEAQAHAERSSGVHDLREYPRYFEAWLVRELDLARRIPS